MLLSFPLRRNRTPLYFLSRLTDETAITFQNGETVTPGQFLLCRTADTAEPAEFYILDTPVGPVTIPAGEFQHYQQHYNARILAVVERTITLREWSDLTAAAVAC